MDSVFHDLDILHGRKEIMKKIKDRREKEREREREEKQQYIYEKARQLKAKAYPQK